MNVNVASIDLGSHTARMLIARKGPGGTFEPLARRRSYVYLAKDFDSVSDRISSEATARAVKVLKDFSLEMADCRVKRIVAVATGVVRKASNRDEFLGEILKKTGIPVSVISGEEEALLTGKGALEALGIKDPPFFVFDLGGGTTEFFCRGREGLVVKSVPLGAMTLTTAFLPSDPPPAEETTALEAHIDRTLCGEFPPFPENGVVIGTGGTVAALCAMQNGILLNGMVPDKMNGLSLERFQVVSCLEKMRPLTSAQRIERLGLDRGRATVMVAGTMVVERLLRHLKADRLLMSMSDLLEGALTDFFEGEKNG